MSNKKLAISALSLALLGGLSAGMVGIASASTAQTGTTMRTYFGMRGAQMGNQGVTGTVSAVSGTTFTVTDSKNVAYTVDASNAKIMKHSTTNTGPVTATMSDIVVGDTVGVRGTISGTSVVATEVIDGKIGLGKGSQKNMGRGGGMGTVGTVTSISGSTITVTGRNGGIYTIDATGAQVQKYNAGASATVALSSVSVGDTIMVRGTIKTATMTATNIVSGVGTPTVQ